MSYARQLNRDYPDGSRRIGRYDAGIRGDQIPVNAGGEPPWMYPSLSLPADAAKLYGYWVLSTTLPFGLPLADDSTGVIPGLPAGVYTATVQLEEDDDWLGTFVVTIVVSDPAAPPPPPPPAPPPGSVPFSSLFTYVLPYVNGCPDAAAEFHLRQAAIEFFQRTLAWREHLPSVQTVAGQDAYTMPAPVDSTIVKLLSYTFDGQGGTLVDSDMGNAMVLAQSGTQVGWTLDRATFTVNPKPSEDGKAIRLHVALKSSQNAGTLPGVMSEQYANYIAHGALASLYGMPGQPWSDPTRSAYYRVLFEEEVGRVGAIAGRSAGRATQRVRAFYF